MRGASKGEGLGNQFLANIREVDAIAHVVRCFEDTDVTHVEGKIDPIADIETIETELMLADLDSLEKRVTALEEAGQGRQGGEGNPRPRQRALPCCARASRPAWSSARSRRSACSRCSAPLLEARPLRLQRRGRPPPTRATPSRPRCSERAGRGAKAVSSRPRSRARSPFCRPTSRRTYLEAVGLDEPGLNRVIRAGYELLGLITYFTVGPKEARAWTITKGTKAPEAAGVIHTDFEKGFIRAETIAYAITSPQGRGRRARCRQAAAGSRARSTRCRTAT